MIAGIAGHQDLGTAESVRMVAAAMNTIIERYGVSSGVTCLARGADQLYAESLATRGLSYTVILPCAEYASVFTSPSDRERFERLVRLASRTVALTFSEPSERAFYEAGKRVVDMSDIVIAAWDGLPAKGLGGTADIVRYALDTAHKVVRIAPVSGEIARVLP